ncbi:MAG: hypothetical protein HXY40_04635 [Chloroflexi bacterium]|nr:hypothetical protein [Chloroflexota bacterium]
MKDAKLYNLTQETQAALYGAALAARQKQGLPPFEPPLLLQVRRGYAESPGWFLVQAAEFDPEALTVDKLRVRHVYANQRLMQALLELMASEKWLDVVGDEYSLTAAGRAVIAATRERTRTLLADFTPLPRAEIERLESLLRRVIESSLNCPEPPKNWSLRYSRRRAPGSAAPAVHKLFHHFSDLNAYRDDAHLAAFLPHRVAGYVWEAFAYVCAGTRTAEALYDQLAYRGHARCEYAEALHVLAARGWVHATDGGYVPSEAGLTARQKVEQLTDDYFYAGWSCLGEAEFEETAALLHKLKTACEALMAA